MISTKVCLLLACAFTAVLGLSDRALLLAHKKVTSEWSQKFHGEMCDNVLVQGRNFTVTVTVYNVGGVEAADIEVEDEWEEDKFTLTDGSMRAAFPSLAPGENAEYSFTLAPQFKTPSAMYEYKPAMVTYMYGEEDEQIETIATSSRPHTQMGSNQPFLDGKAYIIGEEDYEGDNAMYERRCQNR